MTTDSPAKGPSLAAFMAACRELSLEVFLERFDAPFLLSAMSLEKTTWERTLVLLVKRRRPGPGPIVIGRGADCDIVLARDSVSKRHAEIERKETGWTIADVGSSNGTFLDGEPLFPRRATPINASLAAIEIGPDARFHFVTPRELFEFMDRARNPDRPASHGSSPKVALPDADDPADAGAFDPPAPKTRLLSGPPPLGAVPGLAEAPTPVLGTRRVTVNLPPAVPHPSSPVALPRSVVRAAVERGASPASAASAPGEGAPTGASLAEAPARARFTQDPASSPSAPTARRPLTSPFASAVAVATALGPFLARLDAQLKFGDEVAELLGPGPSGQAIAEAITSLAKMESLVARVTVVLAVGDRRPIVLFPTEPS